MTLPYSANASWNEVGEEYRFADFPKDLNGRMNAVTSSLNNGMKALMWSTISRSYRTPYQIRAKIKESIGGGRLPSAGVFRNYAEHTMGPVGAIVRAKVRSGGPWRKAYSLTEDGDRFKPVVDYTMKFFVDEDLDLYEVFATATREAPKSRVDILKAVAEKKELRVDDLADIVDIGHGHISEHLRSLQEVGLVSIETLSYHEGKTDIPYVMTVPIKKIKNLDKFDSERVRSALLAVVSIPDKSEGFTYKDLSVAGNYSDWTSYQILISLRKKGFARPAKFSARTKKSIINLTDRGVNFYRGWVVPVQSALASGDMTEMKVSLDEQYRSVVASGYIRTSPNIDKLTTGERIEQLVSLIGANPGITEKELAQRIGVSMSRMWGLCLLLPKVEQVLVSHTNASKAVKCFYLKE